MFSLSRLIRLPQWIEALIDPAVLSMICAPLLYKLVFKPMSELIINQQESERQVRIATAAFQTHDAIMITNKNFDIVRVNQAFEKFTGYKESEVVGLNIRIFQSGLHDENFYKKMLSDLLSEGIWSGELWDKVKNGEIYPKQTTITAVKDKHGETIHYVSVSTNIKEQKDAEIEIHQLAFFDTLTGLPNRRLFIQRISDALPLSERNHKYGALLFIDLDNFKTINDTLGHEAGDKLLIEVATRLKYSVREVDCVARLGGDEFVVLLENISHNEEYTSQKVAAIANKIRSILSQPYQLDGALRRSSPSIGICTFLGQKDSTEEITKRADIAMYEAKKNGRNQVRFFNPILQKAIEKKAKIASDLSFAIERKQLELCYQVQVSEKLIPIGAEALLRWNHHELGVILPDKFIAIAEESFLIIDIGDWMLESACQQIAKWSNINTTKDLVLAVNISAHQFNKPDFFETVSKVINRHKIDPSLLRLELTESAVMDDLDSVIRKMRMLKDVLGVSITLDDFGTGYSSLSYLKNLPLDQIKIDKSFVFNMTSEAIDAMMVKNIIEMANNCGFNVIAEGVETEAQLQMLQKIGCKSFQGYLFGKPESIEKIEKYLESYPKVHAANHH